MPKEGNARIASLNIFIRTRCPPILCGHIFQTVWSPCGTGKTVDNIASFESGEFAEAGLLFPAFAETIFAGRQCMR